MFTLAYGMLNTVIWLPTGSRRLRSQFVDELQISPGSRALELGCGTGQVSRALVAAERTWLPSTGRRGCSARPAVAPTATFVKADIATTKSAESKDNSPWSFSRSSCTSSPSKRPREALSLASVL